MDKLITSTPYSFDRLIKITGNIINRSYIRTEFYESSNKLRNGTIIRWNSVELWIRVGRA